MSEKLKFMLIIVFLVKNKIKSYSNNCCEIVIGQDHVRRTLRKKKMEIRFYDVAEIKDTLQLSFFDDENEYNL